MESTKFSSKVNANNFTLKQQVMLNQFISIAGCSFEDAIQLLVSSNWQYQVFTIILNLIYAYLKKKLFSRSL